MGSALANAVIVEAMTGSGVEEGVTVVVRLGAGV
jgi:hypothetical protein